MIVLRSTQSSRSYSNTVVAAHHRESAEFFKALENQVENDPYMILFGQDDFNCTVARWTGTHVGPLKGLDGQNHPATHRKLA